MSSPEVPSSSGLSVPVGPATSPVSLVPVDRAHRAVLANLGQLYRHDLSGALRHLPNADGTFNNRRLDRFLAEADPDVRAWLITVAGSLAGFAMRSGGPDKGYGVHDFFVVRALRRTGVGREAARQLLATASGRWTIGFQSYNPGVREFWCRVATDAVGDAWTLHDGPPAPNRPPDTFLTFTTG